MSDKDVERITWRVKHDDTNFQLGTLGLAIVQHSNVPFYHHPILEANWTGAVVLLMDQVLKSPWFYHSRSGTLCITDPQFAATLTLCNNDLRSCLEMFAS